MKNGGKNKSVAFIILFSVYIYIYIYIYIYLFCSKYLFLIMGYFRACLCKIIIIK